MYEGNILYGNGAANRLAASDLTAKNKTFVKRVANDKADTAGAGEAALGVLWNAPMADDVAWIIKAGSPDVYVGTGGVTVGDEIAADAAGLAVTAAPTDVVVAIARETAAAGALVKVDLLGEAQYTKA